MTDEAPPPDAVEEARAEEGGSPPAAATADGPTLSDPATDDVSTSTDDDSDDYDLPPRPGSKTDGSDDASDASGDGDDAPPSEDPTDALVKATSHKEDGNAHFKSSKFDDAARSYRKGVNLLKKLNVANSGDEQVKRLLVTLQTNLSMVCYKQGKHRMSRDVATKALDVDGTNVKALYRRAVARRALGDTDDAKADLRAALKVEPDNASVKKEWASLKRTLEEQRRKEKAGLRRAFSSKGGSVLYSDKEEAEKKKAREKAERKRREEEKKERRKKEWEDECVRRMASDPPEEPITFDDWDKERKKKEEEEEKARKKAKKEEEDRKREERRKARKAAEANRPEKDDSDDELTEQEVAMLRGYKKTSDGRTTSYFNREQTEHEKNLIGCIQPKRLEAPSPTASVSSGGGGPVGSAWNQSGTTWEERDTTDWCKQTFEKCLLDATAAHSTSSNDDTYVAVVKKVKDLKGDASVAIAGGKKRYIYDFHASVEYKILDDADERVASGTLKLPDVNSATTADEDGLEVEVFGWTKAPGATKARDAAECRDLLVRDVRRSVLRFVEKFNANF